MYNFIAKHIFAPSLDLIRGTNTIPKLRDLEQSQWWPRDKIIELQSQRLRYLIQYAYSDVPYYRNILDERSLHPDNIKTWKDLHLLPVLTKKLIKNNYENIVAKNFPIKKRVQISTSGSTGEPLVFYDTIEDHVSISFAASQRMLSGLGVEIGDPIVALSVRYQAEPYFSNLTQKIINNFRRKWIIYSRHTLKDEISYYANKIELVKPKLLLGCPSAIYQLARFIQREPKYKIRPKAITTDSEQLYDYQRKIFREVFDCEVYDCYDTEEQHIIAFQCTECSGYHIAAENTIVEVVDDNNRYVGEGQKGRILITNLNNFAMPFIRYDIGDVGVSTEKSCSCGRGLPLLASLEGRSTDVIVTKSRGKISGNFLFYPAYPTLANWGVEQYQIVQEDYERIVIKIVPGQEQSKDITEIRTFMAEAYKKILGEDMKIDIEIVDEIPVNAAGKRRFILSNVT